MIKSIIKIGLILFTVYLIAINLISSFIGPQGFIGSIWEGESLFKFTLYAILITHITITSMSLSFHRFHTHKGVILNGFLDGLMQLNLWLVGGMSKLDWVSVHVYHHAHSDKEKDPHSPVQKGIWHVLLLGVFDYTKAKSSEPVLKIRKTLKANTLEKFIASHTLWGVIIMTAINLVVFGPKYGTIVSLLNFSVSPIFAVGGVNGLAHWIGYRNHNYPDNSRNLGFLLPLNFLICGELDHNNHHAHPKSCSFRHRWFEFDWGYFYIQLLEKLGLANVQNAYTTSSLKKEMSLHVRTIFDRDSRFRNRAEQIAKELNTNYHDLITQMQAYIEGRKVNLTKELKDLVTEAQRTFYTNYKLGFRYN